MIYLYILIAAILTAFAANAHENEISSTDSIISSAESNKVIPSKPRYPEQIQHQKLLDRTIMFTPGEGRQYANSNDSTRLLLEIFYADQFRAFQDPEAPYFMLMSKDAHLALGLGGVINVKGWYDWNGVTPGANFSAYNVPIPKDPLQLKKLSAGARNSGVFLTLLGRNTPVGDFFAYLEGGFRGYNNVGFRVRKAFITVKGITAGYALTTFLDVNAFAPGIDGSIGSSGIDRANVLVRYYHNFKNGWSIAGALEFPNTYVAEDEESAKAIDPWIPDVVAFGQYSWHEGFSHVRLSGLLRTLSYRNMILNQNHNKLGWGLALTTAIKIIPTLTFYGTAIYGAGHGSYVSELSYGSHDLVGIAGSPGELQAPLAFSYMGGFKYNFRPDLYAAINFCQIRNYEKNPSSGDNYKYGLCGNLNLFWEVTPRLLVGAEGMIGKRVNFNHSRGVSNRVQALFQLNF